MCAEVQASASAEPGYILVTSDKDDRPLDHAQKRYGKTRLSSRPLFQKHKDWRDTLNNLAPISTAQLSPECHIFRQIVSAVHNRPAAQLIFADLAGMFMVNVIAGGRSYRK
jgi:hypothetical protein